MTTRKAYKYSLTYFNSFEEPYYNVQSKASSQHITKEAWMTNDIDVVFMWIKDILDCPLAELSIEQIYKEFDSPSLNSLTEAKAVEILNYYNGRLALYKTIFKDLDDDRTSHRLLHYQIPEKYNMFEVTSDTGAAKQIDSYIEIAIS